MRDSEVVAAIVAGDPAGLAEAYDRYAAPLYTFCRAMLREPADAADAVQDTFVIAAPRLSALRDPERLRPWLYAVARNECHRRLRRGSQQAPLEEIPDLTDEAADVAADVERAELRALVREALPGVGPAEREVLELQLRQGLNSGEVASVLGVSRNHAHALLSRARDQLETALAVIVVARTGRQDCPALGALLGDWDGRLTILLRKRVNRHVERCDVCSGRRQREMTPAMLLGVAPIAALPLAAALSSGLPSGLSSGLPSGLRDQVLRAAAGNTAHPAHPAYPFGRDGFPRPLHPLRTPWWHPRLVHAGAVTGTAAAAAVAVGVTIVGAPSHHGARPGAGSSADVTDGVTPTAGRADPGTVTHGPTGATGASAGATGASATAAADLTATPAGLPGISQTPAPAPASTAASASASVSASTAASASASVSASAAATSPAASSAPAAAGTLSVSPATLSVVPPASGVITLTASGGTVDWSVSEPPGLAGKVVVAPTSGTLAAGATTTVTITVDGHGKMHVHLTFTPGGSTVTVVIG
jgi:RNA polymerase sigma factor (sigma-70 family)